MINLELNHLLKRLYNYRKVNGYLFTTLNILNTEPAPSIGHFGTVLGFTNKSYTLNIFLCKAIFYILDFYRVDY